MLLFEIIIFHMLSFAYTLSDNHAFSCTVVNLERAIENGFL